MQLCEWFPSTYFSTPKISIVLFFGFYCYFVFSFKSEIRKSETQSRFNNEFSLLNLIDCALFRSKIFCAVKVLADTLDARTPAGTFTEFLGPTWGRIDRRLKGGVYCYKSCKLNKIFKDAFGENIKRV